MPSITGTPQGSGTIMAATSHTRSYTTASDATLLVVCIGVGRSSLGGPPAVSTVVWNGQNLTKVNQGVETRVRTELWALLAPATSTTANCTVTLSGALTVSIAQIGYSVKDTDGTLTATASSFGVAATQTVTTVSVTNDLVLDSLAIQGTAVATAHASQTLIINAAGIGGPNEVRVHSSQETASSASTTMSWTTTGSVRWGIVAISLPGVAMDDPRLPLMGAGL